MAEPEEQSVGGAEDRGNRREDGEAFLQNPRSDGLVVLDVDTGDSALATIVVRGGKPKLICRRSLCLLSLDNWFRRHVILFVEWRWFDRFILLCIIINSILLGIYEYRADGHNALNEFIDHTADVILWTIFSAESVFKIIARGFIWDKKTYLRDPWNFLDFVVVVSGFFERVGVGGGLNFLRLFRLLRPLRSLNAVPQMKILVNTALSSILKLGNVIILGAFLFMVFGIIGVSLMDGIFYHRCHTTRHPVLMGGDSPCWSWNVTEDERLCGGNYNCADSGGFCGGHEADLDDRFRPVFEGGRQGHGWCEGSEPRKLFPETDFVHFDNMFGALLLVFQTMTLEGWTELMYMVEDAFSSWFAIVFFLLIVVFTNFFMLNVALAVVDEVQDEFRAQAQEKEREAREAEGAHPQALAPLDPPLWLNCKLVVWCDRISRNEWFNAFILLIIFGNVLNMCLQWFSLDQAFGYAVLAAAINVLELVFLGIFIIEMFILVVALGPKGYVKNPITCFDGFVVVISIIELVVNVSSDGGGGGLSALRTFRLFRIINKLANKWTKLKVLLKAMFHTGAALNYWLVLFVLVLYIFTLMLVQIFAKQFRFEDPDALYPLVDKRYKDEAWCPETDDGRAFHFRQDCIPRAHFDTFTWGFVTVFQVMTGENWNTIMYAGMRASERWEGSVLPPTLLSAILFVIMILFGQTVFLSIFLSMLISKFGEVQELFEQDERMKRAVSFRKPPTKVAFHIARFVTSLKVRSQKRRESQLRDDESPENQSEGEDGERMQVTQHVPSCEEDSQISSLPDALPGQMPDSSDKVVSLGGSMTNNHPFEEEDDDNETEMDEGKDNLKQIPNNKAWPRGFALFIFSESNPVRRVAQWLLTRKVTIADSPILVFDNVILVCILLSTFCMMADTPLLDPRQTTTKIIRTADQVFAIIFMVEMIIKLIALGLVWGPNAYLKSGWNWLDGIVVLVSIIDFASEGDGPGFLRVLRILRTFRPLRVISRNEGLRVVVQTLFQSFGDLFGLGIVSSLFLFIFALVFLMYLKGVLYQCEPGDHPVKLLGGDFTGLGDNFVTPLCLEKEHAAPSSHSRGMFDEDDGQWLGANASCGLNWERASADTPICLARCDPNLESHPPGLDQLCHRKYTVAQELPSLCPSDPHRVLKYSTTEQEDVGRQYVADMQRTLTLPCGGFQIDREAGKVVNDGRSYSCKETFCIGSAEAPSASCVSQCSSHEFFCKDTCKADIGGLACQACRRECEAACMCEQFCFPLIKDAALCHEQGGSWVPVLSQDFNNIIDSALTLFEISTTEGWVDVMYAAADSTEAYRQPVRDFFPLPWVLLFPLWIMISFMFLINLAVGVIVENFENSMSEKQRSGHQDLLSESQRKWVNSRKVLHKRAFIFDLTHLDKLPTPRRLVYRFISSKRFEQGIMASIVINTIIMALTIFPPPEEWWLTFQEIANYVFAGVFLLEAVLKLFALRCNYWLDPWNRFDFVCIVTTMIGIILKLPAINIDLGAATSVIRILRIARLFRLLRFLKELNRLFMCLLISIPKLYNVMMILGLFLVLFSILGMSLFSTSKFPASDPSLNVHGNFQTFWRGFITLFRASTGEAWNEIMHDLIKNEQAYFREGDWCTPQSLFKSRDTATWNVLQEKCLIETPNACPGGWNPLPTMYWVSYTLLITFMIMNLVVAVILKGYEEGKEDSETDTIDMCIEVWKKYDPDQKMKIPLPSAMRFLRDVMAIQKEKEEKEGKTFFSVDFPLLEGSDISEISRNADMRELARFARMAVEMNVQQKQASKLSPSPSPSLQSEVTFMSASRQALRLMSMKSLCEDDIQEIASSDERMDKKDLAKLQKLEHQSSHSDSESCDQNFLTDIAAQKIQRKFRDRQAHEEKQGQAPESARKQPLRGSAKGEVASAPDESEEAAPVHTLVPARAG